MSDARPVNILRKLTADPFNVDDVPPALGDYAATWAAAAGADTSLTILAAICAAAAVIDDRIRLEVDRRREWFESARIWAFGVAPPGSAKTPAEKSMLAPIFELHREEHEAWAKSCQGLDEEADRPPQPRLFVSDTTIEKLADVLVENPGGMFVWNDELGSIIGSHDQYKSGGGGRDRYEWMRLFDGGPHQVERVKRGSFFIPNWGASILSATTPHGLAKFSKKLDEDGLLQRFIVASVGQRTAPIDTIDPKEDRDRYHALLRRLRTYSSQGNITVMFSPEAAEVFRSFELEAIETMQAAYSLLPSLGGHLAKHPAIVARLTLIFHAVQCPAHPASEKISKEAVELAMKFARKARRHALSVYSTMGNATGSLDLARDVARWLLADEKRGETLEQRDIVQRVGSFRSSPPEGRGQAMALLVDYAWLTVHPGRYEKGYPTRWSLNPALREIFAAEVVHEQAMRKARFEMLKERTETC
ncbi:MAG TPA: DUF3987 domain-containing protein [Steroidobacteraceae bacterium]|jgi:hypothetical protein|nr:DUF3987 domain-containing protein [Steroidobacteraceae bacterium]